LFSHGLGDFGQGFLQGSFWKFTRNEPESPFKAVRDRPHRWPFRFQEIARSVSDLRGSDLHELDLVEVHLPPAGLMGFGDIADICGLQAE
jgi:hypothetical protein